MDYGWSIKKEDWLKLDEMLSMEENRRWHRVRLDPTDRDSVPQSPGVYMICAKSIDACSKLPPYVYSPMYVGKAEVSLRKRFLRY